MRIKESTFSNLDNLVFKCLLNVRSRNVTISATILKTKARELDEKININGFQASDGWLDPWKNRYNVSFKTVCGEGNSCTSEMTTQRKETTIPTILSRYKLDEIYNADEFGLFFCMQPNKSLNLQSETCIGEKHSKIRFTGMVAACAAGDKIPMFVLGKSKSPRCFKGIKQLPCRYRNQNKSWMDSVLFKEWIREMDTKFTKEKKKIAFIIDNCPAHPTVDNLKSIKPIFLPQNTTSKLQPMDQGVIRSLKVYYRSLALQRLVVEIDKKKDLPVFSILDAMKMLHLAWQKEMR
ncbi:tigger transposable element-derived protein 4-like [Hydra vulgaris]|uniref:tigger transposable element-derived protein 4-like n=1 Tax=Hydra vulgaris TaxID=6087 RepID=UPI0002B43D22|nr:tigger transposable element-derived protein 4-like [Hydra vulgaris]